MGDAPELDHALGGKTPAHGRAIAAWGLIHHRVITAEELLALGVTRRSIECRIRSGQLHPRYRGVFAIGTRSLTVKGEYLAAVKACGAGALLSHFAAAHLTGVWASRRGIDVTVPWKRTPRPGIKLHESDVPDDERTTILNIPATVVARVVLDLAPLLSLDRVKRVMNLAERLPPTSGPTIPGLLERYPRKPGAHKVRKILAEGNLGRDVTKRELEARFQEFLRSGRFSMPEVNAPVQLLDGTWIEVDCLWRKERVIAELDSRAFHDSSVAFEQDRLRDMALAAAGYRVVRITWARLHADEAKLAHELRSVLRDVASFDV
jgi:very-short-patch-repair endonuclease